MALAVPLKGKWHIELQDVQKTCLYDTLMFRKNVCYKATYIMMHSACFHCGEDIPEHINLTIDLDGETKYYAALVAAVSAYFRRRSYPLLSVSN